MCRVSSCTKLQEQSKLLTYFQIPISSCVTEKTIALHEWNMQVEEDNTIGEMIALTPDKNRILLIPVSITVQLR